MLDVPTGLTFSRVSRLSTEAEELWHRAEAIASRDPASPAARDVLQRLVRLLPERGEAYVFAHRKLGEALALEDPWTASLHLRKVVAETPEDDGAWGLLGLAQSLLGHHRFAVRSYEEALTRAPHNPWYAHNLGHLYDVVFDDLDRALPLLERAVQGITHFEGGAGPIARLAAQGRDEVVASYAHALMRRGHLVEARRWMRDLVRSGASPDHHALYDHIVAGQDRVLSRLMQQGEAPPRRPIRKRRHTSV
ncbi:MAG: hypothetical protein AAFR44_09105 [Pseudomonadota bacterium]